MEAGSGGERVGAERLLPQRYGMQLARRNVLINDVNREACQSSDTENDIYVAKIPNFSNMIAQN